MFSRSFSAARKNSEDDIKARALVNRSTVRRPPASSGEHNYAYTEDGFRVFKHSQDNYPQNLVADYQHFMKDASKNTILPYHHAITALHHAQTTRTAKTLLSQARILQRLAASTTASTTTASGELPNYGLILVLPETEEVRRLKPHPIAGYDNERRESYKAKYEKIRDRVHADAIAQAQPQPQPESDNLPPSMLQRKFMDIKKSQSASIERPLSIEMLTVARSVAMLQVTPISALQPHHRIRTVAGSLASLLALHLCCEKTFMLAHIDQKANKYREVHNLHFIHHDAVHHILRRASGSQCRANKIAARYTECASKFWPSVPSTESEKMKKYVETKFAPNIPIPQNSSLHGPRSFHLAKFFARECLKLIDTDTVHCPHCNDTTSAKWAKLRTDVLRVRRGELTANQVMVDPGSANDYWVYSIYYTFNRAVKHFLDANTEWSNSVAPKDTIPKRKTNWPGSQEIGVHMPRVIQTGLMIREMYRFIIKASPVLSTEFSGVFGYNMNFIKVLITRAKHLATEDGDEASALTFGHFLPCMMTPDVHLDICVEGRVFQDPELYVKMSDRVFGQLKKEQQDVIPSRHTGTIERAIIRC